jgi:superfamily I DNA/RNA helicase
MHMEHLARVRGRTLREQYQEDCDDLAWPEVDRIARALTEFKRDEGLLDYTDMLTEFLRRGTPPKLRELVVDEAQDQSALQWRVVEKIAASCERLRVAGDDDQAIYRWAGADSEHMLTMAGEARVLDQSWRVPPEIQRVASEIVRPIRARKAKMWRPRSGTGAVDRVGQMSSADLSGDDVLVLVRNIYVLREQVEPALRRAGVIYEKRGRSSLDQRVLRAVTTWEDMRRGGTVPLEDARLSLSYATHSRRAAAALDKMPDGASASMADLRRVGLDRESVWHDALDRLPPAEMSYLLAALRRGEKPTTGRPRVRVSTVHGEKGGQAKHVILLREMAHRTYREMEKNRDDERRVWYVAATRAIERLTIVNATTSQACPWL